MDEDFEEWSDDALKARYDLVKEFDQMVDKLLFPTLIDIVSMRFARSSSRK